MVKVAAGRADRFCASPDAGIRLVLIYGPNEGLVRVRGDACTRAIVADPDDPFRVTTVEAATLRDEPGRLADEAAALSLTGGRRVVRVRGATETLVKAFESCLGLGATESLVVAEAGTLTPRSGLRRLCEQKRNAAAVPCYDESESDVEDLIESFCSRNGITIDPEVTGWLAERIGTDRAQISSELDKIATYLSPEGAQATPLTIDVAESCIGDAAGSTAESIARLVTTGDLNALDRAMTRALYAGIQPITVLRSVGRRLLRLHHATADVEQGSSAERAIGALKPPIYPREQAAFAAEMSRWTSGRAARALELVVAAERDCKISGASAEAISWYALLRIGGAARNAAA